MASEVIYNVYWEGPYEWEKRYEGVKDYHVLYQIYGAHHLYGRDVLLYIGLSQELSRRLDEHNAQVDFAYDKVSVRFGAISKFLNWDDWRKSKGNYKKANPDLLAQIEALLIYAHQPIYNNQHKWDAAIAKGIRIFNTGHHGQLFPEISHKYFS